MSERTIRMRMTETKAVIETPIFTGLILLEEGLGELVGRDEHEEEAIKKLMKIREERERAITIHALSNREQDIPAGTEEKIKDNRDPNSETKQTLRLEMKPIIENMYARAEKTTSKFITMKEIHDECMRSDNLFTQKHIHSVSSRIREWVRLGMILNSPSSAFPKRSP